MQVNLYLKDGNVIKKCNLYPEEVMNGQLPYTTKEEIDKALSKVPWGFKFVSFQTENINGKIHVNNIDRYEPSGTIKISLGDKVRITKNINEHGFPIGKVVTFIEISCEGGEIIYVFEDEDGLKQGLCFEEFEWV